MREIGKNTFPPFVSMGLCGYRAYDTPGRIPVPAGAGRVGYIGCLLYDRCADRHFVLYAIVLWVPKGRRR